MALGCVRVDLTVRLGSEVEGVENTATWTWLGESDAAQALPLVLAIYYHVAWVC